MNDFELSGGASGSWLDDLVTISGQYFDYRKTVDAPYTLDSQGRIIMRGQSASNDSNSPLAGLIALAPLALLAGVAFLLIRALK